jgi:hypothetical protein
VLTVLIVIACIILAPAALVTVLFIAGFVFAAIKSMLSGMSTMTRIVVFSVAVIVGIAVALSVSGCGAISLPTDGPSRSRGA